MQKCFNKLFFISTIFLSSFFSDKAISSSVDLKESFNIVNDWGTGYQVDLILTNPSSSSVKSWSGQFNLKNGEVVSSYWNTLFTVNGSLVQFKNADWNGSILPGGSTSFGYVVYNAQPETRTLEGLQATGLTDSAPVQVPAPPTLNVINVTGPAAYTVSWSNVFNATSYTLQQSTTSNFANPTVVAQGNIFSKSFSNQANGTYYYRVFASNANGNSQFSNIQGVVVNVTSTVPAAPVLSSIIVNPSTPQNYTVTWNAVTNATSYTLQQSTSSNFATATTVYQGAAVSKAFSGQATGTYYYRVRASNASGDGSFSNVQSVTVSSTSTIPAAPVLNAISVNSSTPRNYTVSWNAVSNATLYTLQQSTSSSFANPTVIYQGSETSKAFTNQANGTYYYRVASTNELGSSTYSNIQSVTITGTVTPSSAFIDSYWESWDSTVSIDSIVNMKFDIVNVAFVTFTKSGSTFTVTGLDANQETLTQFVTAAHAAGKKVKISVGGATYGMANLLTSTQDAQGMAQAIATFVNQNALDGVDFDIEDYPASNLQIALLQNTRQLLGSNAIISYTPKTPTSTTTPYKQVVEGGYQYLDYISMMCYDVYAGYDYKQDVQALIAAGVPAKKIVVGLMPGLDDVGVTTTLAQISDACNYILQNNLGGIMFWDLNRDYSNATKLGASAATNTAWSILHS